ncbi:MAG TPA: GNAT family N-acetyltransferase [Gemmatimonadales bacterium]|nr:GNAT family N-acetyltransferase [Gemmatimonadales bacterium]
MPTIDVVRTYLEMTSPGDLREEGSAGPDVRLEPVGSCPWHFYRYLYVEVGRLYHWRDRLPWTEAQFRAWLAGPSTIWLLSVAGAPAGFFELRGPEDGAVEIAYFGVLPEYQGRGLGRYLLTRAVQEAWQAGAARVWLHTCTLDHPGALPNYLRRGFRKTGEEVYTTTVPD